MGCFIDFSCVQQGLERTDERTVAEGASVIQARFELCPKWNGLEVYARFQHGAACYDVKMVDGAALIPWEVLKPTGFSVSVWGEDGEGGKLTSEALFVPVASTVSLDGFEPIPSSPTLIGSFVERAAAAESAAAAAAESAAIAPESAAAAAQSAAEAAEAAGYAENRASMASLSAAEAKDAAEAAAAYSSEMSVSVSEAAASAAAAAASAAKAVTNATTATNMASAAKNSANASESAAAAAAQSARDAAEAAASAGGGSGETVVVSPFDSLIVKDSGLDSFSIYDADECKNIMLMADDGASLSSEAYDDDGDGVNDSVRIRISAPMGGGSGEGDGGASVSASAAAESAQAAAVSASEAAASALAAAGSAEAAASSANTASDKAANAAANATTAVNAANTASNKANAASDSAAAAANSANNASAYVKETMNNAASAYASETEAQKYADAASESASAANTSAGTATGKATAARNSADAAKTSETAAATYAEEAAQSMAAAQEAAASIAEVTAFDPTAYRLPILYLTGSTDGISKENAVTLSYEYGEHSGSCTLKWQGSSSLAWDKKNYTIKTDTAFEAVEGWGAQKKYCLKANWIDHSHSRNVVSAKLWGLVRKSRSDLPASLSALPNAGAIDGFPVIVMLNGEFHGLYSFNIPKDAWQFGMGSGTKEAIVGADNQADDTAFKAETLLDADGWELEYNSSGFSETAVKDSLNNLIRACMNTTGSDLDTTVAQYLDWESAIDYYIFAVILKGGDMITKNTLLATFDGVKWYFSAYDMDTTYGLEFDGSCLTRAVSNTNFEEIAAAHRVFELIKRFKTNELKARYNELRANALSETRICQYFENYLWDVSSPILAEDVKRWTSVRGSSVNGIDQICRWVRQRLEAADAWADALPAQETPVEPVVMVNQVPISTDTDGSVFNGTGYKDNARLSSSGGVSSSAQTGSVVTGFIPCTVDDVIRIKGAKWIGNASGHYYFNLYDSAKTFKAGMNSAENGHLSFDATGSAFAYDNATGITTINLAQTTFKTNNLVPNTGFFRVNAYGKGADLIVTVNQEITE